MNRLFLSTLILALPALTIGVAGPSKPAPVQGGWRTVEVTVPGPNGRTFTNTQPNLTIFTAKHYSRTEVHADNPRPILSDVGHATADELRAAWGPFVAEAGSYEVTAGNIITMRPVVAKNPATADGAYTTYSLTQVGDTIWVTAQANEKGTIPPVKIKAVRVE